MFKTVCRIWEIFLLYGQKNFQTLYFYFKLKIIVLFKNSYNKQTSQDT